MASASPSCTSRAPNRATVVTSGRRRSPSRRGALWFACPCMSDADIPATSDECSTACLSIDRRWPHVAGRAYSVHRRAAGCSWCGQKANATIALGRCGSTACLRGIDSDVLCYAQKVAVPAATRAGRSFNGRTRRSGRRYRGSNPCLPASLRSASPSFGSAGSASQRTHEARTSEGCRAVAASAASVGEGGRSDYFNLHAGQSLLRSAETASAAL